MLEIRGEGRGEGQPRAGAPLIAANLLRPPLRSLRKVCSRNERPLGATFVKNLSDIDALFTLPLAEFTAARNGLAARLKKEGKGEEAQRVKALGKPSATAWAVNQLYWRHRRDFDRLLTVIEKVRDGQIARAGDLRALLEKRRAMITALAAIAEEMLSEAGHAASPEARRRVVTTLESLTARDPATIEREAGRLTADLEPLGFDDLADLLAAAPSARAKVLDFQEGAKQKQAAREKQKAEAERAARARAEAIAKAEAALANARREAARAEKSAAEAAARQGALEQERQRVEARLAAATDATRAASAEVEKAARAVADAERALARAREP
jgi:hypothetical protein